MKQFSVWWARFEKTDNLKPEMELHWISSNHRSQSYMKSQQSIRQSRNSTPFFNLTDWLLCFQNSHIPYFKPNDTSILSHIISFTIHHNIIILLHMPMPPNWSNPFRCSGHNSVQISDYLMHIIWSAYPSLIWLP